MADGKKEKHRCPPIADGWTLKVTGPDSKGLTAVEARKAWQGFVRLLNNEEIVRPMTRRTYYSEK